VNRRDRDPRSISTSLDHLLGNLNAPPVDVLDLIFRDWSSIVGPDLARHTRPAAVDGGRLVVTAGDSAWANEFQWLEKQVLERLSEVTESARITSIHVRVSPSS
jgi:predicted nucleic acid-binding Zn ribbon protein